MSWPTSTPRSRMGSTSAATSTGRTWTTSSGRAATRRISGSSGSTARRSNGRSGPAVGFTRESRPQTASTRLHAREPQDSGDRVGCDHPQLGAPAVPGVGPAARRAGQPAGARPDGAFARHQAAFRRRGPRPGTAGQPRRAELLGVLVWAMHRGRRGPRPGVPGGPGQRQLRRSGQPRHRIRVSILRENASSSLSRGTDCSRELPVVRRRRSPGDVLHRQAGHHGRGRGQAGWRRCLPRADAAREMPVPVLDPAVRQVILGYLGAGALLAALVMGGFSALLSFWSGIRQSATFIQVGRRAFYAAAAMTFLSAVVLEVALLTHDFSLAYVVEHTDLSTPTALVAAAFYGGQEGSLLYWTVILSVLGSASLLASASLGGRVAAYAAGILASILTFFLFVLAVVASPFDVLSVTPPDGLGLNPILRDGGMLIHPPVVLAGFASFAIPFSFACAALLAGRVDAAWITHTRRFALLAWSLQTAGLLLGMWWAYHVLGWGGYWGWDPVENVALMPWLATTAYLHSSQVQERRGRLRLWNFGLVITAFLLVVFGTFIVRSGVVPSVHTFAISAIGPWFLGFLGVCLVFSIGLLALR